MSQEQHIFLDELGLGRVIDYIKTKFASLSHSHKLSEITDYSIDSVMSSTSTNPVQNSVLKMEFDAIDDKISQKTQVEMITWEADD